MIIRPASIEDLPAIIEVLKAGLGESSSQKTIDNWKYKHIDNPFGPSIVYVAEKNERIIGVRALMKWNWQFNGTKHIAWRAVDTATHPNYQRQGVFSKLTLEAIKEAAKYNNSFIFNTPNKKSKPGYLKLGWQVVGKVKVILVPTPYFFSFNKPKPAKEKIIWDYIDEICLRHNFKHSKENKWFTPKSKEYLFWRYNQNPFQTYSIYIDKNLFLAFYIKKHLYFNELRVSELIGNIKPKRKFIKNYLLQKAKENNCMIISHTNAKLFPISIKGSFGPELVINTLKNNSNFESQILNYDNWSPNIGDLELF